LNSLSSDVRYAIRTLSRDRGFAAIAVLTLGLGIGANTAIFSIVNSVLLKPLAYREPGRLYVVAEVVPGLAQLYPMLPDNALHFTEWRKRCSSFERMAAMDSRTLNLTGAGEPERVDVVRASANLFDVLGVQPRVGRGFMEEEDQPGRNRVVVIADSLWKRRFNADPALVGKTIRLDGAAHVVAGILPPDFRFPSGDQLGHLFALGPRTEIFKPLGLNLKDIGAMGDFNYTVIARVQPNVSQGQALAELNVVQADIAKTLPEKMELRAALLPLQEQMVGAVRRGLLVLLGAVGAVLLIVSVNLANLSLARSTARARESAIRTALGASRARLVRQALTESALLAALGGALGLVFALWGLNLLVKSAPVDLPRLNEVHLDGRVLAFASLVSAATGLLFGILPAWRFTSADPQHALRAGGRTSTEGIGGTNVRNLLVGFEVGLSAVLLIVAGLLMTSFVRLMNVNKGFNHENLLTVELSLPADHYGESSQRSQFFQGLLASANNLPGVRSSALISSLPLQGETWVDMVSLEGDRRPMLERPTVNVRFVSPSYFQTAGIPLRSGRAFEERDRTKNVALFSEMAAGRLWPRQNPLGKRFARGDDLVYEMVGVVADVRSSLKQGPVPTVYYPYWDRQRYTVSLMVRTSVNPGSVAGAIRSAIWKLDSSIAIPQIRTMDQLIAKGAAQQRFQMLLVVVFGAAALLLASLGIYGVVSYSMARRTNEIGIRMALGARSWDLHRMVLRQGLTPVVLGLAAGISAALGLGRVLSSLLFEVRASDPVTIAAVASLLVAVGTLACLIPAIRATRIDPMTALRDE
jgi:predicted permease